MPELFHDADLAQITAASGYGQYFQSTQLLRLRMNSKVNASLASFSERLKKHIFADLFPFCLQSIASLPGMSFLYCEW
jgi:hypothetical protein